MTTFKLSGELMKSLPEPDSYAELAPLIASEAMYKPFSPFPFSVRDVAVFVPDDVEEADVMAVVEKEKSAICVVGPRLFDTFTKKFSDGTKKTSYAYRLVFQAPDRNLTSEEVESVMKNISNALNTNPGWQVR